MNEAHGDAIAEDTVIDKDCIRCNECGEGFVFWFECECCPHCGADV